MYWKLITSLALAVLCGGWIHGSQSIQFLGNPNATVSTIDTTTITASRSSGELPAFVQVSASSIAATGTMANGTALNSYEDLDYTWDFGDPAGTENFTNPVTNQSVTANRQSGPEAAYVYRTAGAKTITLTTKGCAVPPISAGLKCVSFRTAISTITFTASAFDKSGGEWYFDSVNGLDANSGLDSAHPKQSIPALNALMTADHLQFNLARGSNWVGTTGIYITRAGVRIVPYGSGANPIVNVLNASNGSGTPGASFNALSGDNTSRSVSNLVVSNVDFWRSGTTPNSIVNFLFGNFPSNNAFDIYFDKINIVSDSSTAVQAKWLRYEFPVAPTVTTNIQRMGMWGGSINRTVADQAEDIGIFGGARYWNFFVGVSPFTQNGQAAAPNLVHSVYVDFQAHGLFRWLNFGGGTNLNANIKISANTVGGGYEIGDYYLVSENNLGNVQQGTGFGNSAGIHNQLSDVRNVVVQSNAFHDLSLSATTSNAVLSATWRYNNVWNIATGSGTPLFGVNNNAAFASPAEMAANAKFYGNNIYRNISSAQTSGLSPFCQKTITGQGVAVWDNGSGSSGDILTVSSYSGVSIALLTPGEIPLFAPAVTPGNAIIQPYGTAGTTGVGGTGTYKLSQSSLVASVGFQAVLGWTTPWTITDNIVYDTSTTPVLMDLQFTNQAAATVDRNTWYAPNGHLTPGDQVGTPFFNNRFSQTFAQLKAAGSPVLFSIHDLIANPNWADPANGNFNQ